LEFKKGLLLHDVTLLIHPRRHVDCAQLSFHVPTLPPPFLPAGASAPVDFVVWCIFLCLYRNNQRWLQASKEGTEASKSGSFKDEREWGKKCFEDHGLSSPRRAKQRRDREMG
jgi:hypothetical protein